ncbi:Transcription elongation factor 1 [Carex littledalei]|uniref:Transcription elongation factor 1 homolog n=1 Tax=Carex littledalei TaxID=544730 RepID=A0A833RJG6_9POAL|nr:Transcription elongation factor 1 [Carex littledalei]
MGKRKSRRVAPKIKPPKLDTEFVCPICNYGKNVTCTINLHVKVGTAECFVCKSSYTMEANAPTGAAALENGWLLASDTCPLTAGPLAGFYGNFIAMMLPEVDGASAGSCAAPPPVASGMT